MLDFYPCYLNYLYFNTFMNFTGNKIHIPPHILACSSAKKKIVDHLNTRVYLLDVKSCMSLERSLFFFVFVF